MWDATPWMIQGARHSADVGRVLAWAATKGAEGIIRPTHLRVTPTSPVSGAVNIGTGGAAILGHFPSQTYIARNPNAHTVDIQPNTGGAVRHDMVIARIIDPQFEGQAPEDPFNFQYVFTDVIQNVAGNATEPTISSPAIPLARVRMPAGATEVTEGQITDLRKVANPRKDRTLEARNFPGGYSEFLGGENDTWPNDGFSVDVPDWATYANIIATWDQVRVNGGDRAGQVWTTLTRGSTSVETVPNRWDLVGTPDTSRIGIRHAASRGIPAELRGTTIDVFLRGSVLTGGTGNLRLDGQSSVSLDIEFHERRA